MADVVARIVSRRRDWNAWAPESVPAPAEPILSGTPTLAVALSTGTP
jgi:hypothetical protein